MRHRSCALVLGAMLMLQLSRASADPATGGEAPVAQPVAVDSQRWYGWQVLSAYAASDALLVLGATKDSEGLTAFGAIGVVFAGPIVHWVHGHGWRGLGSYLISSTAAGLSFGVAMMTNGGCPHDHGPGDPENVEKDDCDASAWFLAPIAFAQVLDAVWLGWEGSSNVVLSKEPSVAPIVSAIPGGGMAGVVGRF
ncbi:MAG: hypothetical protein HY698_16935 [Deltaproteobacteria bacterium]|nr:hypothetical protein [Deltaproteobacteria bacterium]